MDFYSRSQASGNFAGFSDIYIHLILGISLIGIDETARYSDVQASTLQQLLETFPREVVGVPRERHTRARYVAKIDFNSLRGRFALAINGTEFHNV